MTEIWLKRPLGPLVSQVRDSVRVESGVEYPLLGVRWYSNGAFLRETVTADTAKVRTLYRAAAGQFIYNRLFAYKGSFAVVTEALGGSYVSNEFPLYACDTTQLLAEYLVLHFSQPDALEQVDLQSKGSTASRNRWKEPEFEKYQIPLPTLSDQRRIVHVIDAIDAVIAATEAEADAAAAMRTPLIDHLLAGDWPTFPLGKLGTFTRGKRFTKADYTPAGLGCIHYGQIYTDYGATAAETITFIPESLRPRMRLAHPGDLIVAGTSENLADVGKAVAWIGTEDVAVHDDAYIYHHTFEPNFAPYLFASTSFQQQKITTESKVVRISKTNLEKITIPVPDRDTQNQIAETIATLDETIAASRSDTSRLRDMRAIVLGGLLSQTINVGDLEDSLL
jgi:type I restriction enzyme S subunit